MAGDKGAALLPTVAEARNERLRDAAGHDFIDLCMGYGSVWLGHNHPAVSRALSAQLQRYAAPGYLPTEVLEQAESAFKPFLPDTHFLGGIYSTGMEAMETALRAASVHARARDIAGFRGSTHGRSYLTAAIGSDGSDGPTFVHSLPSFAEAEQAESGLRQLAQRVGLAAIVVEPVQMTGGGHEIPRRLCDTVFSVAREHGVPVLFDEALTGLYRCGERYFCDMAGDVPDLLVIGKGMANGFPAAAVILRKGFSWDRARVKPGSTFWNHPLACAATAATLDELSRLDAQARVRQIESVIRRVLGHLELRGRGALWCLGCPGAGSIEQFARGLLAAGVVVSYYDRTIRLLPPLLIDLEALTRACEAIRDAHAAAFR